MFRVETPGLPPLYVDGWYPALWRVRDCLTDGAVQVRVYLEGRLLREWVRGGLTWVN